MRKGKKKSARNKGSEPKKATFSNSPFKGLKLEDISSVVEKTEMDLAVEEQSSAGEHTSEDLALLDREMADVTPLKDAGKLVVKEPKPKPLLTDVDEESLVMRELDELVHGETPFDFADTDEYIEASVAGLDRRILRKLKRGEFSFQAHLDLHGMNREQARAKVAEFIRGRHAEGKRCVLIVHGRGFGSKDNIPVLKMKLAAWLTRGAIGKKVLAFTSARPYDGGTGAVYVLLRDSKK
jgi:DNA-nicking Smr family endonuclease